MIEKIRNYYGLMTVVLVALGLALIFSGVGSSRNSLLSGGHGVLRIAGRSYDQAEFHKLGESTLRQAINLQMYEFVGPLGGFGPRGADSQASEKFFINRMLVREAAEEFGIHPSDEEINDYLKKMPAFANAKGEYEPVAFRNYIEHAIGSDGLIEHDIRELASDAIICHKLSEILGSGLGVNRQFAATDSALRRQSVSGQAARIPIASFKEAIKPTDDEIKTYWDVIQDSFKTEPKRKFTYFLATPQVPEVKPDAKPPEDGKPEDAKPEKPDPTKEDPAIIAERKTKQRELDNKIDDLVTELSLKKGAGFEELAKKEGFEIKTTELITASAAPADLALSLRSSSRGGRAVDLLFDIKQTSDPFSKISDALAVGENQWLVARLDGEEPSRVKTFDEAKDEARLQYIEEKAREAMRKSGEEQVKKIREAVTGGKSFADAAKENGLESKTFGPITSSYRASDPTLPASLFQDTYLVDPGTVADLVNEADQDFIVFVEKREVAKTPDDEKNLDSEVSRATSQLQMVAFMSWLDERTEEAKVERLYQKR